MNQYFRCTLKTIIIQQQQRMIYKIIKAFTCCQFFFLLPLAIIYYFQQQKKNRYVVINVFKCGSYIFIIFTKHVFFLVGLKNFFLNYILKILKMSVQKNKLQRKKLVCIKVSNVEERRERKNNGAGYSNLR